MLSGQERYTLIFTAEQTKLTQNYSIYIISFCSLLLSFFNQVSFFESDQVENDITRKWTRKETKSQVWQAAGQGNESLAGTADEVC